MGVGTAHFYHFNAFFITFRTFFQHIYFVYISPTSFFRDLKPAMNAATNLLNLARLIIMLRIVARVWNKFTIR